MTSALDLDINNYSIKDIEQFFRFKPKSGYNANDVELRECEIREQLISSGHINKRVKRDVIEFLTLAKQLLIERKCPLPVPTSIPKNYQLDTVDFPRSKEAMSRQEELVHKPPTQFIYTQNSDFFPGTLNPLEKRVVTKVVCVDTLFRPNYSRTKPSDFLYTLPESINNVTSMQLISLELPRMWYTFSAADGTNEMTIEFYNLDTLNIIYPDQEYTSYEKITIIIPDGNYTSDTFEQTMNKMFRNLKNGLEYLVIIVDPVTTSTVIRAKNQNIEYGSVDSQGNSLDKYAYSNDESNTNQFYFVVDFKIGSDPNRPLYKNMGWMMGFRKSQYTIDITNSYLDNTYGTYINYVYADTNGAIVFEGYLRSESSYGCMSDNYIFIEIDDFHNNFPTDTIISMNGQGGSYLGKNIIARITLTSGANTIVDDTASDMIFKKREYFGPVKIEKLNIRLLNRFGDVLNINQNDFSFALELKQLYS